MARMASFSVLFALVAFLSLSSPAKAQPADERQNIIESLASVLNQNTTLKYLNDTGLLTQLSESNQTTLLAPEDSAYAGLPAAVKSLLSGPNGNTVLKNLLLFHIIPQYKASGDFQSTTAGTGLPTLLGPPIFFVPKDGENIFYVNKTNPAANSTSVQPDILPDTVISIQGIDKVLVPLNLSRLLPTGAEAPAPSPASPAAAPAPSPASPAAAPALTPATSPAAPIPTISSVTSPPPATPLTSPPPPPPKGAGSLKFDGRFVFGLVAVLVAAVVQQ